MFQGGLTIVSVLEKLVLFNTSSANYLHILPTSLTELNIGKVVGVTKKKVIEVVRRLPNLKIIHTMNILPSATEETALKTEVSEFRDDIQFVFESSLGEKMETYKHFHG